MNPRLQLLQPYPFERLRELLQGVAPNTGLPPISLSIGEPRHSTPAFIQEAVSANLQGLAHYPLTLGQPLLREAVANWLERRYGLRQGLDPVTQVIPTLGSREALFALTQVLLDSNQSESWVLCPNPFYQIYEGATLLAGARPWFVAADDHGRIDYARVPGPIWERTRAVFVCSPGNPTGHVMNLDDWRTLFELSDRYGAPIISDECYSEIYPLETSPPLGGLEAAAQLGRVEFPGLVVMGSLSKRSSVPGLRSGFAAGDAQILQLFLRYRTYHGSAMGPAIQAASAAAWQDEIHVQHNRALYRAKMEAFYRLVHPWLSLQIPAAGFYYWVKTPGCDLAFTRALWRDYQVGVLPGSLLARTAGGSNPGNGRIRIALVGSLEETLEAAQRLVEFTRDWKEVGP